MIMLPRHRTGDFGPYPNGPFVLDWRSHDIPTTISRMIAVLPTNCVALSLRYRGGYHMVRMAEKAARKKGVYILWLR